MAAAALTAGKIQRNSERLEETRGCCVALSEALAELQLVELEAFLDAKISSPIQHPPSWHHPPTPAIIPLFFLFPSFVSFLFSFLTLPSSLLSSLPSSIPPLSPFSFFLSFFLSCTFLESSGKRQVPGSSHSIPGHSCHWAPSSQLPCPGHSVLQISMPSTF